ncbi:hypothetical protein [Clostridium sp. UBA1652]|uniref:hypothetical protein n=1 Tax=Clostridium sp. UBA1652 TaxID=1946348 RepID=UPI002579839C|nr:hypothetical protein [Clostridium sp. UBA1652]
MSKKKKPLHILRYGTNADQKFIENMNNPYDLLAINGNMLAHSTNALTNFILKNILNSDRGFFIDPITYAFQLDLDMIKSKGKNEQIATIKKSVEKMIRSYGEPLEEKVLSNDEVVSYDDFKNGALREVFCRNVLDFQNKTVYDVVMKKGYLEYEPEDSPSYTQLYPEFLIAPYFYLTPPSYKEWLDLNIEFLKISKTLNYDREIYAQITISKDLLVDKHSLDAIISRYNEFPDTNILIWIDSFDEHTVSSYCLEQFIYLTKNLSIGSRKIINLYGGFFSILLAGYKEDLGFGLYGVGHGLEYGEFRAVAPVGGGIPTSKYYFYPIHQRVDYKTASELIRTKYRNFDSITSCLKYHKEICACPLCKDILKNDIENFTIFENSLFYNVKLNGIIQRRPYASKETKEACLYHYLFSKNREFHEVSRFSFEKMAESLEDAYIEYTKIKRVYSDNLYYLLLWKELLFDEK